MQIYQPTLSNPKTFNPMANLRTQKRPCTDSFTILEGPIADCYFFQGINFSGFCWLFCWEGNSIWFRSSSHIKFPKNPRRSKEFERLGVVLCRESHAWRRALHLQERAVEVVKKGTQKSERTRDWGMTAICIRVIQVNSNRYTFQLILVIPVSMQFQQFVKPLYIINRYFLNKMQE